MFRGVTNQTSLTWVSSSICSWTVAKMSWSIEVYGATVSDISRVFSVLGW